MKQSWTRRSALTSFAGLIGAAGTGLLTRPALAEGNLASNPVRLPELKIDTAKLEFSETSYELETGKYYFWTITADEDADDLAFTAPGLFRNSWINQIVINDLEVHTNSFYQLEFDDGGSMTVQFIPVRPGQFDYWCPGYETRGLKGSIMVN